MKFLSNILSTVIGIFVFCIISIFVIIFIAAGLNNYSEHGTEVEGNSILELNLEGITYDYSGKYEEPWGGVFSKETGFIEAINSIKKAKTDNNIKGISILNGENSLGMSQIKELRDVLEDFKTSKKFVFSYSNNYSQKEYYLASIADKVYINPAGYIDFKGLSSDITFLKNIQEKTGIKVEVIRHGKYKSAVERYISDKISDANKEQITSLLNSVWKVVIDDISKTRKISTEKLNQIANDLLARTPEMAKKEQLIDIIAYEDIYNDDIKKLLKTEKDKDYNRIKLTDYIKGRQQSSEENASENKIAIIYAQGEIRSGEGDVDIIGEGSMRRSLKEAREDDDIKAVVLRIDSPGGSSLTSELIWREVELTKKVKPVVVSMGNVAASGGYYIACGANTIIAEGNTITGSIGVFGVVPNAKALGAKIGVNTERIKTHDNSDRYAVFTTLTEKQKIVLHEQIEQIYKTFVGHVAEGRKMTFEKVDAIAQGRVWSGNEALKIGLIDKIGNLDTAISEAMKLGKINDYSIKNFPKYKKDFGDYLNFLIFSKTRESIIKKEIGTENYQILEKIKKIQAQTGIQAMLPFEVNIN